LLEQDYNEIARIATQENGKTLAEAKAGNVGVNIGVAAPVAYFPFSGWNR
jgi:malonate-semialdehyde dehydrogenase (acetylating)/methylmalonate-semialdehyde dehydrogenase